MKSAQDRIQSVRQPKPPRLDMPTTERQPVTAIFERTQNRMLPTIRRDRER